MRRRSAFAQALCAQPITGRATVDHHAARTHRQLERQRVGVRVAHQVVGPEGGHVGQQHGVATTGADVAAVGQVRQAWLRLSRGDGECGGVSLQFLEVGRNAVRAVVEEPQRAVGVRHAAQPVKHARGRFAQPRRQRMHRRFGRRSGADDVQQVEQVFQRQRVVHRAALELAAIGQDLLGQFTPQNGQPAREPGLRFGTVEVQACHHQRLGVGEEVVAQQMPFEPAAQPARLRGQAVEPSRLGDTTCSVSQQEPLDPVDDAQRGRVRFPAAAVTRRVFGDPACHQRALRGRALRGAVSVEVVEVVQVVSPQTLQLWIVPGGRAAGQRVLDIQEAKARRPHQRRLAPRRHGPNAGGAAQRRCRPQVGPRLVQAEPHAAPDLLGAQVAHRAPEPAQVG